MRSSPAKEWRLALVAVFLAGLLCAALQLGAQLSSVPFEPRTNTTPPRQPRDPGDDMEARFSPEMQRKVLKLRNEQRQKQIVSDTARLLQLAKQLQAEIDKEAKSPSTGSLAKKADEIEKLARNVKDHMKSLCVEPLNLPRASHPALHPLITLRVQGLVAVLLSRAFRLRFVAEGL